MFRQKDAPAPAGGFRDVTEKQEPTKQPATIPTPSSAKKGKEGKEVKAKKDTKQPKPPLAVAVPGHNSGEIPAAIQHVVDIIELDEKKKAIGKAQRDHRNALKVEFGIHANTLAIKLKLLKMDPDVMQYIESNLRDFDAMLGNMNRPLPENQEYADPSRELKPDVIAREG